MDSLEGKGFPLPAAKFIADLWLFYALHLQPIASLQYSQTVRMIYCFLLLDSMHFIRRWRRPPSLSRVNFAATTNRRSSSRAGGLLCSFSNTTAATRSLGGWSPTTAGLLLLPWCSTNWGKRSATAGAKKFCNKTANDRGVLQMRVIIY